MIWIVYWTYVFYQTFQLFTQLSSVSMSECWSLRCQSRMTRRRASPLTTLSHARDNFNLNPPLLFSDGSSTLSHTASLTPLSNHLSSLSKMKRLVKNVSPVYDSNHNIIKTTFHKWCAFLDNKGSYLNHITRPHVILTYLEA